jgi:hypothetical protein
VLVLSISFPCWLGPTIHFLELKSCTSLAYALYGIYEKLKPKTSIPRMNSKFYFLWKKGNVIVGNRLISSLLECWIKKLKYLILRSCDGEWLGIYNDGTMSNPIEVYIATWRFRSYANNSIQQKVILPNDVHVFMVGQYSKTLGLLADQ